MTDVQFQIQRLQSKHDAIHKEVEWLESQRDVDRSYLASANLKKLKKQKLQLKDAIAALQAKLS
jgi:uncharacterized protein YdcH (DUF465 family)